MRYIVINFCLTLNFVILISMLCVCNSMVYFVKNLFYKKLCNDVNILWVNTNINWFPPIIMNFVRNYSIRNYVMVSILLNDNSMN